MTDIQLTKKFKIKLILLMGFGLALAIMISFFQHYPGYMDADYYFAGGIQLAEGKGFTEPYLWNYFDPANTIPHPSHAYWMPLTSIFAAGGMLATGSISWLSGRLAFFLIAMVIPAMTAILAFSFSKREDLSIISGILAIFSGYYAVYMQVTDSFCINMFLGGLFFLLAHRDNLKVYFILGILSGFFHLARADGVFWLIISFIMISFNNIKNHRKFTNWSISYFLCILGYMIIMGPWFIRNIQVFGSLLGPQATNVIWLTNYDQIFSYPPNFNTLSWWNQGLSQIITTSISALKVNLLNMIAVQGNIILLPLILIGAWKFKKDIRVGLLLIAWIGLIILMSIIYPYAGMRGGYFHAGAALQPILWSMVPIGLEVVVIKFGQLRNWDIKNALRVFSSSLVIFSILFTIHITINKLYDGSEHALIWGINEMRYQTIAKEIEFNQSENLIVIVGNPPGFYLATGDYAIAIPDGDINNLLLVADDFNADYLILEPEGFPKALEGLYNGSYINNQFEYLGEFDDVRIFRINHDE
jgi:hypothetical protein